MVKNELRLDEIERAKLGEVEIELKLAREFLKQGLIRNAAGKAFQAWKALISALSIMNIDLVDKAFPGHVKVGSRRIKRSWWVAALAPIGLLTKISSILEPKLPGIIALNTLALDIHDYQYNGADPQGLVSKFPDDDTARAHVEKLIEETQRILSGLHGNK